MDMICVGFRNDSKEKLSNFYCFEQEKLVYVKNVRHIRIIE